ncbi:hypothetical protein SAMN05216490_1969 [Mucilaginibacter mallensis]|uniref:Uncharacterized protein n=1 Tax=Mucilaginibacter mallensis TaxID=652787 RepID=A0A1H1VN13_MUCMA|nr:hypothetical protein [Mucilaginibacter mallensis]SDS86298.1 hypothetical protein SAMN05216490_1969 [Mucilaginibacter mallensis]
MNSINTLFAPVLKAVAALANNGGLFKKRIKKPFDPKITMGFNYMLGM